MKRQGPALRLRGRRWQAKVRIPKPLRVSETQTHVYRTLSALDKKSAEDEARLWEAVVRAQWREELAARSLPTSGLRPAYEGLRAEAERWLSEYFGGREDLLRAEIDLSISRMEDEIGERDLSEAEEARLAALQDTAAELDGRPLERRPFLERTFSETAGDYIEHWRIKRGLRASNTRQQKEATFRLFASYFRDRPIRHVRKQDAAAFADALRRLDPNWARAPKAKAMSWRELQAVFGGREAGLSDATMNRHMTTLQDLWKWAEERGHCEGRNPFKGHRINLQRGLNVAGYLPWEVDELQKLLNPPPARSDLTELILVGLFTGMRIDEIASLTFGQIKSEGGVPYIQINEAKTLAGRRQVPLHPRLAWLSKRRGRAEERVWPAFNPEGPGKKPGADAGREFSRFKIARGFTSRTHTFHSFRKCVAQCLERAQVPENEARQILGHAREFTFGVYSPHGVSLQRKAEIMALIDYPGLSLPEPSAGA